ncbi:MAG: BrnT family toxin [Pseudomonadota bacterium]
MIRFEWDSKKASANQRKHGISFEEAKTTFYDEFALQFFDEESSGEEDRFILLGLSVAARVLVVVHCERDSGDTIRIISARKATRREANQYQGPVS